MKVSEALKFMVLFRDEWDRNSKTKNAAALDVAIKSLEVVNKIIDIIKTEQQPTSCEHTKLKSFEMIEKIITDYQLRDSK